MQPIYIEVSDEITTVIERMKAAEDAAISLVVPKGAVLLQSIVNLKLAKKAALDAGKDLTLVTTDKIGRNLATQVGVTVVSKLGEEAAEVPEGETSVIDGVKIHRYYDEENPAPQEDDANAVAPIVPREILQEKPEEEPPHTPIVVREIKTDPIPEVVPRKVPITTEEAIPVSDIVPAEPVAEAVPAAEVASPKPPKVPKSSKRKALIFGSYLLILCFLGAIGVSAFYLPKTTVSVAMQAQAWKKELSTVAKVGDATLPAELITSKIPTELQYSATGSKDVGDTASGSAKIFNGESSDSYALPAGSSIVANGLTFHTTEKVTVPGARVQAGAPVPGSASVDIVADQSGPTSNMSEVSATLPGKTLYGQITKTTGGTTKEIAIVTETDIANARALLTKKARENADLDITKKLQNRTILFDAKADTYSLGAFNSSAISGTATDVFTVKGTGTLNRLVVDKAKAEQAVKDQLKDGQQDSQTYTIDNLDFTKIEINMGLNQITLTSLTTGKVSESLDTTSLRSELVGKKKQDGENILKSKIENGITTITQSPRWWPIKNFPYSNKYLTVQVTYE